MHSKLGLAAVIVLLLSGIAGADTVTLTGSCQGSLINATNNTLAFNLSNSGDGIATNLLVLPTIFGASTQNSMIALDHIFPGNATVMRLRLSNFTNPGSYADYFDVQYSQGSSTFYAVFPCLVTMNSKAFSLVSVAGVNRSGNTVQATLVSLSNRPINLNVSFISPPEFTITPKHFNITIQPQSQAEVYFNISNPLVTQAGFASAISTSYMLNGTHYSSMHVYVVNLAAQASNTSGGSNTLLYFMVAVIVIILALIAFSVIRKKPNAHHQHAHEHDAHRNHTEGEHHHHTAEERHD